MEEPEIENAGRNEHEMERQQAETAADIKDRKGKDIAAVKAF